MKILFGSDSRRSVAHLRAAFIQEGHDVREMSLIEDVQSVLEHDPMDLVVFPDVNMLTSFDAIIWMGRTASQMQTLVTILYAPFDDEKELDTTTCMAKAVSAFDFRARIEATFEPFSPFE